MTAVLIILAVLVVLVGLIVVAVYNGLVRARNKVDEGWSGIDVQLTRRHDLIPNLVESVKAYAAHERAALDSVLEARSRAVGAQQAGPAGAATTAQAEASLTGAVRGLLAVAEAYPDLKASNNFLQLQDELSDTEDQVAAARRIYNGNVQSYNSRIQTIPGNLIAGPFGFTPREFYEAEDPATREPVRVSF